VSVLRYLLMPGPSPTPRPRAKARPTPTPTTPTETVLRRLGLGRASGLAPRSMIIVFAPSLRVAATANVGGAKAASVGRREGLALALPTSLGWSMLTSLAKGLGKSVSLPRPSPRSLMSWYHAEAD